MLSSASRTFGPSVDFAFVVAAAISVTASQPRPAQLGSRSPYFARHGSRNFRFPSSARLPEAPHRPAMARRTKKNLSPSTSATGRNTAMSSRLVSMIMSRPSCLMFFAAVSVCRPARS